MDCVCCQSWQYHRQFCTSVIHLWSGYIVHFSQVYFKDKRRGRSQDGRGIRQGDHFLFYKSIERTTEQWTKFTKQILITSGGHQAPRKAAHCLQREEGQGYLRLKRETREESRWRRSRTGRSLSLLQIHWKNNSTVNKVYKTTSDR